MRGFKIGRTMDVVRKPQLRANGMASTPTKNGRAPTRQRQKTKTVVREKIKASAFCIWVNSCEATHTRASPAHPARYYYAALTRRVTCRTPCSPPSLLQLMLVSRRGETRTRASSRQRRGGSSFDLHKTLHSQNRPHAFPTLTFSYLCTACALVRDTRTNDDDLTEASKPRTTFRDSTGGVTRPTQNQNLLRSERVSTRNNGHARTRHLNQDKTYHHRKYGNR